MVVTGFCLSSGKARNSVESACNRCNLVHLMDSDDEVDEVGQAFDAPEQAASHHEHPWLDEEFEELNQHVAAMPDPLPPWAKTIWMEFLNHVQEEQDALKVSIDLAAKVEVGGDERAQEVKGSAQEVKET